MSSNKIKLTLLLCLVSAPVWAQEQPEAETVMGVSRDWAMLTNSMRHTAASMTSLIQERNALAAQVKTLEARIKVLEEQK